MLGKKQCRPFFFGFVKLIFVLFVSFSYLSVLFRTCWCFFVLIGPCRYLLVLGKKIHGKIWLPRKEQRRPASFLSFVYLIFVLGGPYLYLLVLVCTCWCLLVLGKRGKIRLPGKEPWHTGWRIYLSFGSFWLCLVHFW